MYICGREKMTFLMKCNLMQIATIFAQPLDSVEAIEA